MENIYTNWKKLASEKRATNTDNFMYCVLRALSKENPEEALDFYIKRHYSPRTSPKWKGQSWDGSIDAYASVHEAARYASWRASTGNFLNAKAEDLGLTAEDIEKAKELIEKGKKYGR